MRTSRPSFIVGVGGSAGGLSAYRALLTALPCDTGMAFVIVSHMLPDAASHLAAILARHTKMPVKVAVTGMRILPDHVYVSSPNSDLLIKSGAFDVVTPRTARNEEADRFLISLAEAMGPRAISIVMSGYDGDGTSGSAMIKAKGGMTFAQDSSAEVGDMPITARAAGCIDHVLPPGKIAQALEKIARHPEAKRRRKHVKIRA